MDNFRDVISKLVDTRLLLSAAGAFFGAFAAFMSTRASTWFQHHVERRRKHRNALVKLERVFATLLNTAADNRYAATNIKLSLQKSTVEAPRVSYNVFHDLDFSDDLLLSVINLDFVNAAFSCQVSTTKMNRAVGTLNMGYGELRNMAFAGKISMPTYQGNLPHFIQSVTDLEEALLKLEDEIHALAAIVRVLLRKKHFLEYAWKLSGDDRFDSETIRESAIEKRVILKEIKERAADTHMEKLRTLHQSEQN